MWKKVNKNEDIRSVSYEFPVYWIYTVGRAGKIFFENLMREGVLTGAKCKKCGKIYLPPRIYCEVCFEEIEEFLKFPARGTLLTWTKVYFNSAGEPLKEAQTVGFIKISGTDGGLIHRIMVPEGDIFKGMPLKAKLKPHLQRKGNLNDIEYFERGE